MANTTKKLAATLTAIIAISLTGCGSDSNAPLIVYVSRASGDSYAPHLYTLDVTTQKSTAVTIPVPSNAAFVASNRDATAVTYSYNTGSGFAVFLMGTDGKEKQLTTGGFADEAVFSPDGKTIVYLSIPAANSAGIFMMSVDGSNQKAVYAPAVSTVAPYLPEFSPDGKALVFYIQVSAPGPVATSGWYTMALTDTNPTLVYATNNYWGPAVYSADGKKLLLTVFDGSHYNISSINLDGAGLTQLTTSTDADNFSPVPDKNGILFNRYNSTDSSWGIYAMDQTGANQVAVVSSTASTPDFLIDAYFQ